MQQAQIAIPQKFHRTLYFRVLVGIFLGVLTGVLFPQTASRMEPLGLGFVKLIKMMIGPIIFFTVVVGIASIGDMRKLGRVGLKSLLYFEVVTTLALVIGLVVVKMIQPGAGMNVNVATLDAKAIATYANQGHSLSTVDFLMGIIPTTFIGAFSSGEILQVLLLAILVGIALGAFGAMALTVGKYGLKTLLPLMKLMACVYLTSIAFVFVVLGTIATIHGFS